MENRAYWQKQLREAEAELDVAKKLTDVNAAAKKLERAKAELKALEDAPPKPARPSARGASSRAVS